MSIEELVRDLKRLTPEQLDQVVTVVHGFSRDRGTQSDLPPRVAIPQTIVDDAVNHSWPRELFTEILGSLPELERAPQPGYDVRETP